MKILIVRLSALGDIVHTLPVAQNAAAAGAAVGWIVERPYRAVLEANPAVGTVFIADTRAWRQHLLAAPAQIGQLSDALRTFGPDLTLWWPASP
jgi:heptosyltransferase-1